MSSYYIGGIVLTALFAVELIIKRDKQIKKIKGRMSSPSSLLMMCLSVLATYHFRYSVYCTSSIDATYFQLTNCPVLAITYNIPRACLLNRSTVPAMVLKSNRSGLWRHIIWTCRRLRWLCRRHLKMSRDMIKIQLSQQFCRATQVSCPVGVIPCCNCCTFRSCNTCIFSLTALTVLRHTT